MSQSQEQSLANYKPGGTSTIVIGPRTTHACMDGQDPHGLGRWSYLELEGKNDKQIVFVTGYRSCNQPTRLGLSTYHDQQYRLLLQSGKVNPNPREQFLDDIIHQIKTWRLQRKAVLLCMDANDDVSRANPHSGIGRIAAETDLMDLHKHKFPATARPATHTCGSLTINICLGSPEFLQAMVKASILPFGQPTHIHSDHRTLIVEFDSNMMFGNASRDPLTTQRGVYSNTIPIVKQFCEIAGAGCEKAQIAQRIAQIKDSKVLTIQDCIALDQID